jgi:hypothetical protein
MILRECNHTIRCAVSVSKACFFILIGIKLLVCSSFDFASHDTCVKEETTGGETICVEGKT